MKTVYMTTKKLRGDRGQNQDIPVRAKDGTPITEEYAKLERWKEHFRQILNRPDPPVLADIPEADEDLDIDMGDIRVEEVKAAIHKMKNALEDLDYADDLGLLAHRHQDIQQKTEKLSEIASTIGLKVNNKKTQVLRKNVTSNTPIAIDGTPLEDVQEFVYLGSKVTTDGDCNKDINTRVSKANQAFAMLKPIWRTTSLSIHTKIKIFRSNVISVLLYGSECWKTTTAIEQKLEVFQNKCLRRILKIFWPNTISNE
ncbi:hypothetical protein QTP70_034532 [Hemibagrus guttatus]|uniref:DUF6451 domain-containing protein n=1 Tax=Hemibagrus guttatus TaxID=175788 RepID=A0AAE0VCJ9_9TELE|nr:hypothetical protein QTP70_034532 [Hemibagrus guttatus]